jgi:protein-tyrosine phosphatase
MGLRIFDIFGNKHKQNLVQSRYATDIHSHLIPGIDDGVRTTEEAVSLIKNMYETGITRIITTPHIRGEIYENTPEIILAGLEEVKTALAEAEIPVRLEAAAEYFVDEFFIELMKAKSPLMTFGSNKYLLIEFPHFSLPLNYKSIIFDLQSMGYIVVLAHPERFHYFQNNFDAYKDLYARGVQFQLNLVSLVGYYDRSSIRTAEKLIDNGMYSFAGSDMHNQYYFRAFRKSLELSVYDKLQQRCTLSNDLI